jgi:hypothetical protein
MIYFLNNYIEVSDDKISALLKTLIYIQNIYDDFHTIKITERLQRHLSFMQIKL